MFSSFAALALLVLIRRLSDYTNERAPLFSIKHFKDLHQAAAPCFSRELYNAFLKTLF